MSRFKNKDLQHMYEACRRIAADTDSEFYIAGQPHSGAVHRSAYWAGRRGQPNRLWPKGSLAYAAWAAGQDDLKTRGPFL